MKTEDRLDLFVGIIIIIVLLGVLIGFNPDKVINWLIPIGISFIFSGIIGEWIEGISCDFFKKIYLSFSVCGFRINVPVFLILVFVIKNWLFS